MGQHVRLTDPISSLKCVEFSMDLGEHRLKDLQRPSHLFQLSMAALPARFPPLRTLESHPNNLPIQPMAFIGREKEVDTLCELVRRPEVRLLTLTVSGRSSSHTSTKRRSPDNNKLCNRGSNLSV